MIRNRITLSANILKKQKYGHEIKLRLPENRAY